MGGVKKTVLHHRQGGVMSKSAITTHVLDLQSGLPASDLRVQLLLPSGDRLKGNTNADGRVEAWDRGFDLLGGDYQLEFKVSDYFEALGVPTFLKTVPVLFQVDPLRSHYHIPLLLSPFGYSTYRGS